METRLRYSSNVICYSSNSNVIQYTVEAGKSAPVYVVYVLTTLSIWSGVERWGLYRRCGC